MRQIRHDEDAQLGSNTSVQSECQKKLAAGEALRAGGLEIETRITIRAAVAASPVSARPRPGASWRASRSRRPPPGNGATACRCAWRTACFFAADSDEPLPSIEFSASSRARRAPSGTGALPQSPSVVPSRRLSLALGHDHVPFCLGSSEMTVWLACGTLPRHPGPRKRRVPASERRSGGPLSWNSPFGAGTGLTSPHKGHKGLRSETLCSAIPWPPEPPTTAQSRRWRRTTWCCQHEGGRPRGSRLPARFPASAGPVAVALAEAGAHCVVCDLPQKAATLDPVCDAISRTAARPCLCRSRCRT